MNRQQIREWLNEHLKELYPEPVEASISDGELLVMGRLAVEGEVAEEEARNGIHQHREESRSQRVALAQELERLTGLAVAWGVRYGPVSGYFSSRRVPVMTRLGREEREVLDTLILSGIVRNRSQAVNWAIQSFARGRRDWLRQLREALNNLREVREGAGGDDPFEAEEPPEAAPPGGPIGRSGPAIRA